MADFAIIDNELVVNRVRAEPSFGLARGWVQCDPDVAIGWTYRGGYFDRPEQSLEAAKEALRDDVHSRLRRLSSNNSWEYIIANLAIAVASLPEASGVNTNAAGALMDVAGDMERVVAAHARAEALFEEISTSHDHSQLSSINTGAGWP